MVKLYDTERWARDLAVLTRLELRVPDVGLPSPFAIAESFFDALNIDDPAHRILPKLEYLEVITPILTRRSWKSLANTLRRPLEDERILSTSYFATATSDSNNPSDSVRTRASTLPDGLYIQRPLRYVSIKLTGEGYGDNLDDLDDEADMG